MAIPAAVVHADKDSDEALALLESQSAEDAESTPLVEAAAQEEEEQTPEAEPTPVEEGVVEVPEEVDDPPETDWEKEAKAAGQRYKSLEGKYKAEVPLLHQQVAGLQQQIATLAAAPAPVAEAPEYEGPDYARHLKESEVSEYDDAVLDLQARMARGVAEGLVNDLRTEMKQEIADLRLMLDQNADLGFWGIVEAQIPGAEEINRSDPAWLEFLTTEEPVSGISYRAIGESAVSSGDSAKLISLFRLYLDSTEEVVAPKRKVPSAKPKKTRSSSPSTKSESKPLIAESDVKQFYGDVAVGKYRGREAEQAKLEKMIDQAAAENRIVSG